MLKDPPPKSLGLPADLTAGDELFEEPKVEEVVEKE